MMLIAVYARISGEKLKGREKCVLVAVCTRISGKKLKD